MKNLKNSVRIGFLLAAGFLATSFATENTPTQLAKSAINKMFKASAIEQGSLAIKEAENTETKVNEAKDEMPRVLQIADSICKEAGVPFELIKEIGDNESNWRYVGNATGGTDFGDLQVIDQTYWYMYDKLNLTGGKTRTNYLAAGIYYLKDQYDRYGTWKKARFAYGRGHWRGPHTWTKLEHKFMGKIDWSKYDT